MGLLMLGAVLEKEGYRVHLLDANADNRRLSTAEIVQQVSALQPDVVGITLVTPLVREAYRLAASLRGCGAKLLAGGPHATLLPEEPLGYGFDAVVVGEGEPTIVEAVQALLGKTPMDSVQGLVYRDSSRRVRHNPPRPLIANLDALPLPARHLANAEDYGPPTNRNFHSNIFTSRGCTAKCAFCAGGLFGRKFRFRSADGVVQEMVMLHQQYGISHFFFVDDAMTMNRDRMKKICRRLLDERLGFTWNMMTRIDTVREDLLDLAARAGCVQIDYGVESGSPATLKKIHKAHTVEMVKRVVPLTRRYGIRPMVFFILGFPWDDPRSMDETLQLMVELAPHVEFHPAIASILIPFPGTEIYERFKKTYGFSRWWLSDDRTYDAPRILTHPFYQSVLYRLGAVLDADFFRYSPEVKAKIHEAFTFMYRSNLSSRNFLVRRAFLSALDLSRKLERISPAVERAVFRVPITLFERIREWAGRVPVALSR